MDSLSDAESSHTGATNGSLLGSTTNILQLPHENDDIIHVSSIVELKMITYSTPLRLQGKLWIMIRDNRFHLCIAVMITPAERHHQLIMFLVC